MCACVSHEKYPPDWAPIVKPSNDCLTISGTYNDDSSSKILPLCYFLTSQVIKSCNLNNKTVYVQINKGDDDALIVIAWNESTRLAEKIYKKNEYTCTDGGIEISMGMDLTDGGVLGLEWHKLTLKKASDDSLVVMCRGGGFGLYGMLIPIVVIDDIQYYKYPQKK